MPPSYPLPTPEFLSRAGPLWRISYQSVHVPLLGLRGGTQQRGVRPLRSPLSPSLQSERSSCRAHGQKPEAMTCGEGGKCQTAPSGSSTTCGPNGPARNACVSGMRPWALGEAAFFVGVAQCRNLGVRNRPPLSSPWAMDFQSPPLPFISREVDLKGRETMNLSFLYRRRTEREGGADLPKVL